MEHSLNNRGLSIFATTALILVGILASYNPLVISMLWLLIFLYAIYGAVTGLMQYLWYGIAASPMLEVWARMSKAPLVPFESGKYYLLLCIGTLLIYHIKVRSEVPVYNIGKLILLFLLPGLIVALSHYDYEQWVFNVLSILELGLLLLFSSRERWDIDRFCKTLRIGLLPVIPILVYLTLKTPSYNQMSFAISANFEAGGGFGSNQVATILGNGVVLTVILLFLGYPIFTFRWMAILLLAYLLFRGILTFSRGGMIGAIVSIVILLLPKMLSSSKLFLKYILSIVSFVMLAGIIFLIINNSADNKLLLRYEGETKGTSAGTRQKTLNTITSGRSTLASADLAIFGKNIFFGVGPGTAKKVRTVYSPEEQVASHTEYARLLSEHGLGGLLVIIAITIFPFWWIKKQKTTVWRGVSAALFFLAIFTSFHSAMRTNTTVIFYVLASIPIMVNAHWYNKLNSNH